MIESGKRKQSILLPRGCDASGLLSDAPKLRGALRRGPKRRKDRRCGDHSMVQEAPRAQSPINVKRAPLSCCPVVFHRGWLLLHEPTRVLIEGRGAAAGFARTCRSNPADSWRKRGRTAPERLRPFHRLAQVEPSSF